MKEQGIEENSGRKSVFPTRIHTLCSRSRTHTHTYAEEDEPIKSDNMNILLDPLG